MRELTEAELDMVSGGAPGRSGTYDSKDHWGTGGPTGSAKSALEGARIAFAGTLQGSYTGTNGRVNCMYTTPVGGFGDFNMPVGYICPPTSPAPKTN